MVTQIYKKKRRARMVTREVNSKHSTSTFLHISCLNCFFFFFFFFFFFWFLGLLPQLMEVPRLGVKLELQPSAHTTTHGNTRSLIHWTRSGIETATSWLLVGFVSTAPQWELLCFVKLYKATIINTVLSDL